MSGKWKPSEELISSLTSCGVDSDILEDLLHQTFTLNSTNKSLTLTQNFALSAVAQQASWSDSIEETPEKEEFYGIRPKTRIKTGWRPQEETLQLLIKILSFDRVKIGFAREHFIREHMGKTSRAWDCLFIQYAFLYFSLAEEKSSTEEKEGVSGRQKPQDDHNYPEDQRISNKILIGRIISELLKKIDVSDYFKRPIDENWQPDSWVAQKLQKRFNLSKRFIYDPIVLKPFISFYSKNGKLFSDYNTLYFHWVIKRFTTIHKLLLEQKASLEKKLKASNTDS